MCTIKLETEKKPDITAQRRAAAHYANAPYGTNTNSPYVFCAF